MTKVDEWVDLYDWGYGYGPLGAAWAGELADLGVDVSPLGDTIGTTYLEWDAGGVMTLNLWGYFQVYGFSEGTRIDFDSDPVIGVSGSAAPFDGYYANTVVYVLSLAP